MKNLKTKKIVLGTVMALSAVSLASVGFANWVINGITGVDQGNIDVSVGQIADSSVTATLVTGECETVVKFDNIAKDANVPDGYKRLYENGDTGVEDLTFKVSFNVSTTGEVDVKTLFDQVVFTLNTSSAFKTCVTDGYITSPFSNYVDAKDGTFNSTYTLTNIASNSNSNPKITLHTTNNIKLIKIDAEFSFGWGEKFNNHNPGYYKDGETIKKEEMKTNLIAFKKAFGENFKASLNILPAKK